MQHVSQPSNNGEVELFKHAFSSPFIRNSSTEQLSGLLRLVFVKIGLRAANFPEQEEKAVLIDFICTHYPNHRIKEIALAFDLAMLDKLEVDDKHYENFTCQYLSRIMTAYRKWAGELSKNIKPIIKEEKVELTDAEMELWISEAKDYSFEILPTAFYDYLKRKNLISNEFEKECYKKAKELRLTSLKKQYLLTPSNDIKKCIDYLESGNEDKSHPESSTLTILGKRLMIDDYMKKYGRNNSQ